MQIIRHILVYALALNMLASSLAVPLIYMDFEMRQDYIAEVLCINRDKPMTKCNGKCYLMQKLAEAKQQQDQDNETINIKSVPTFYSQNISTIAFSQSISLLDQKHKLLSISSVLTSFLFQIFVPPRA